MSIEHAYLMVIVGISISLRKLHRSSLTSRRPRMFIHSWHIILLNTNYKRKTIFLSPFTDSGLNFFPALSLRSARNRYAARRHRHYQNNSLRFHVHRICYLYLYLFALTEMAGAVLFIRPLRCIQIQKITNYNERTNKMRWIYSISHSQHVHEYTMCVKMYARAVSVKKRLSGSGGYQYSHRTENNSCVLNNLFFNFQPFTFCIMCTFFACHSANMRCHLHVSRKKSWKK